ncbi:metallophosphoesterase family protein [Rhizobium oryziradicis]|uniref:Uncharacterized protein n=1 Tax=Rhizobium oryziradicis TaxID=1867956 RepID=A0A1Q8ZPK9_9HYPH|nr:metallophosphoesterase [Rhizobium oryziradicis]OLP43706.1 hypothetical protein BJF95_22995 [Rhizobium oryziradicis]
MERKSIPAILPNGKGHQFVIYGDSCSGVPSHLHEKTFASVNAVVREIDPQPEFIIFPGDEIIGLTPDRERLLDQWNHWLNVETAWLDRTKIPIWHSTGNHTTYNKMSEDLFREVLRLPDNGPADQKGLSYYVRRGDLLLVFINTLWSGLGGEGHLETQWLAQVLSTHADAQHKFVIGHHPVFPVNGFSGAYQREIGQEYAKPFWDILMNANVFGYICSHILAFDVQVHSGVLQICTAGAGTAHRMPEDVEYLHCIQAALDADGLRYQVLDTDGIVRESLKWPPKPKGFTPWAADLAGIYEAPFSGNLHREAFVEFRLTGKTAQQIHPVEQTIFSAVEPGRIAPVWLGLRGPRQTMTLIVGQTPGRSPAYWLGPDFPKDQDFDMHIAFCPAMGPGGMLFRNHDDRGWTSMKSATSRGVETLLWPQNWSIGQGEDGPSDRPFKGDTLKIQYHHH